MYSLSLFELDRLRPKIEAWIPRPDLAYITIERITRASGSRQQEQIERLDRDSLLAVGDFEAVLSKLTDESYLQIGGSLQYSAQFVDEDGQVDPARRQRHTVKIDRQRETRAAGSERSGANNVLDSSAAFIDQSNLQSRALLDLTMDRFDREGADRDRRFEEMTSFHEASLKSMEALHALKLKSGFGRSVRKMWEGTPEETQAILGGAVNSLVVGFMEERSAAKKTQARREELVWQLENAKALASLPAPRLAERDDGPTPLAVPCRSCGRSPGRSCIDGAGAHCDPHGARKEDLASALAGAAAAAAAAATAASVELAKDPEPDPAPA